MQGDVAGESQLIERFPIGSLTKTLPVDFTLLKQQLQVSDNTDDNLILMLAWAAVEETENRLQQTLVYANRRQYFSSADVSGRYVELAMGPVVSVTSVGYRDTDAATQTLAPTEYRQVGVSSIYIPTLPNTLASGPGVLTVDYQCGMANDATGIRDVFKNIVMRICYRNYERPEGVSGGAANVDAAYERALDRLVVAAGANRRGV